MDSAAFDQGSALDMIAACFRHQHPEAFGGSPVSSPILPVDVCYGRDDMVRPVATQAMTEESMGHPEVRRL